MRHLHVGWLLEQHGGFLQAAGRGAEAEAVMARAKAIVKKSGYRGFCGIG